MLSFTYSLFISAIISNAQASLFVTFPTQGDQCAVLQPCQVKWIDDSKMPSTASLGETSVDLVMGNASNLQAVQQLGGVSNPSIATALTFQPIAGLSPTQKYAIRFIPKANSSNPIFSTFFTITGGSGTATPLSTTPAASSASSASSTPSNKTSGSPSPIVGSQAPNSTSPSTGSAQLDKVSANATASSSAATLTASLVGRSLLLPMGLVAVLASI